MVKGAHSDLHVDGAVEVEDVLLADPEVLDAVELCPGGFKPHLSDHSASEHNLI